jgi:hypothetical protein
VVTRQMMTMRKEMTTTMKVLVRETCIASCTHPRWHLATSLGCCGTLYWSWGTPCTPCTSPTAGTSRMGTYYMTRVHIRVRNHTGGGYISRTTHDSTTPHSTYQASVSNAARRALFSLCFRHD